jgi:sulfate adenylyltransferase
MVEAHGGFVLVHVATPLSVCEARDSKGLYAKARAGLLPGFTGVSDPYEPPTDADITMDTSTMSPNDAAELIVGLIKKNGWL